MADQWGCRFGSPRILCSSVVTVGEVFIVTEQKNEGFKALGKYIGRNIEILGH